MLSTWLVRLELARDDDMPLGDEGIDASTRVLTRDGGKPRLTRGDSGTVLVQMTLDARDDLRARSSAERILRDRANEVWSALGLPPFTVAFLDATESPRSV